MSLKPGVLLPTDMNMRQWSRWCKEQEAFVGTDEIEDDAVTTAKIADEAVTLAKLADMTADRILGRLTSAGVPTELTAAEVASLLETAIEALNLDLTGDIGFHGVAASGQQTDPGAPTIATVSGSGADTDINNNFAALEAAVNGLRDALNANGKGLIG